MMHYKPKLTSLSVCLRTNKGRPRKYQKLYNFWSIFEFFRNLCNISMSRDQYFFSVSLLAFPTQVIPIYIQERKSIDKFWGQFLSLCGFFAVSIWERLIFSSLFLFSSSPVFFISLSFLNRQSKYFSTHFYTILFINANSFLIKECIEI